MYEAPKSNLEHDTLYYDYEKLLREQRPVLGFFAALLTTVLMLLAFSLLKGLVPGFLLFVPAVVAGFALKLIGRPIAELHRILPSLAVGGLIFLNFFGSKSILVFVMPLLSAGICYALSRRLLSYEQEKIVYRFRHGDGEKYGEAC